MARAIPQRARAPLGREMSAEALESVAARLRLVGEPMRVRLLWLLDAYGPATVNELYARMPPTTHQNVSKHLGILHRAGVVQRTRDQNRTWYELIDWTALWLVDQVASIVAAEEEPSGETPATGIERLAA